MLYWYRELMLGDKLKRKPEKHMFRLERYYRAMPKSRIFRDRISCWERFVGKKIPWKDYTVVIRSTNPDDLFDVMRTRQWVFRHYARTDFYVIGLYTNHYEAIDAVQEMLSAGYQADAAFDPRKKFENDEDYDIYSDIEVGTVDIGEDEPYEETSGAES